MIKRLVVRTEERIVVIAKPASVSTYTLTAHHTHHSCLFSFHHHHLDTIL